MGADRDGLGQHRQTLAWSSPQAGSQTIHAHTRANLAAAQDLKKKLQEIAALELAAVRRATPSRTAASAGSTFAQAAEAAIKHGGKFDGHEMPADINGMTKASVTALAGQGLIGVARDNFGREGQHAVVGCRVRRSRSRRGNRRVPSGRLLSRRPIAAPSSILAAWPAQLHGGGVQGFGQIRSQKWVYDQRYGVSLANRFHYNKPPTILDIPLH